MSSKQEPVAQVRLGNSNATEKTSNAASKAAPGKRTRVHARYGHSSGTPAATASELESPSERVQSVAWEFDPAMTSLWAPTPSTTLSSGSTIFRHAVGEASAVNPSSAFATSAAGQSSTLPFKAEMETAFNTDFSDVRVFLGRQEQLDSLGASAATRDNTIVFGSSSPDRTLVAHELTHIVQGRQASSSTGGAISDPAGSAEKEAERTATRVATGQAAGPIGSAASTTIHREQKDTFTYAPLSFPAKIGVGIGKPAILHPDLGGNVPDTVTSHDPTDVLNRLGHVEIIGLRHAAYPATGPMGMAKLRGSIEDVLQQARDLVGDSPHADLADYFSTVVNGLNQAAETWEAEVASGAVAALLKDDTGASGNVQRLYDEIDERRAGIDKEREMRAELTWFRKQLLAGYAELEALELDASVASAEVEIADVKESKAAIDEEAAGKSAELAALEQRINLMIKLGLTVVDLAAFGGKATGKTGRPGAVPGVIGAVTKWSVGRTFRAEEVRRLQRTSQRLQRWIQGTERTARYRRYHAVHKRIDRATTNVEALGGKLQQCQEYFEREPEQMPAVGALDDMSRLANQEATAKRIEGLKTFDLLRNLAVNTENAARSMVMACGPFEARLAEVGPQASELGRWVGRYLAEVQACDEFGGTGKVVCKGGSQKAVTALLDVQRQLGELNAWCKTNGKNVDVFSEFLASGEHIAAVYRLEEHIYGEIKRGSTDKKK